MEYRILGPVEVLVRGEPVYVGGPRELRGLVALLLNAGRVVTTEQLGSVLWGATPPPTAPAQIRNTMAALRRYLAAACGGEPPVTRSGAGFFIDVRHDQVDLATFRQRNRRARELIDEGRSDEAAIELQAALAIWRGPALGDLGAPVLDGEALGLEEERLACLERRIETDLVLGLHQDLLGELAALVHRHPLRERLVELQMTALYRAGRRQDALDAFKAAAARLAEVTGLDPRPQLASLQQAILREEPGLDAAAPPKPRQPAQLPMATPLFTGRHEAIDLIASHITLPPRAGAVPVPRIVVVHGMPGVGKTALALQVAHRVRKHYAGGQLFADLRGETRQPTPPQQVLAGFLRALGVADRDLPTDIGERCALLRSNLSGRRVLILLDDAKSAKQVLPLLPADSGNDLIITSRHPLVELPAQRHRLEPLDTSASLSLLAQYIPPQRVAEESLAAAEVASYCAGLPLALAIAGALAQGGETLADVARTLRDSDHRVQGLTAGHLGIRRVLHSGYLGLGSQARTALRQLALLPCRSFASWTIQALLDTDERTAEQTLREILNANLVSRASRHYTLHDLVRLHLRSLAQPQDTEAVHRAVLISMHLADAAMRQLTSRALPMGSLGFAPWQGLTPVAADDPRTWFDSERTNLMEALQHSASHGQSRLAAGLLNALTPHLRVNHRTDEWRRAVDMVLTSAQKAGDTLALAYAHDSHVLLHIATAQTAQAMPVAERGLELFDLAGDPRGRSQMLFHLHHLKRRLGDIPGAMQICQTLIATPAHEADTAITAAAHQGLGVIHRHYLNELPAAQHHLEHALRLTPDTAKREYSQISYSLATVYLHQGRTDLAEPLLTHALKLMRASDDAVGIASMLTLLSDIWTPDDADAALTEALALARRTGHHEIEAQTHEARARLHERAGDIEESLLHLQHAADIYEMLGATWELTRVAQQADRLKQQQPGY